MIWMLLIGVLRLVCVCTWSPRSNIKSDLKKSSRQKTFRNVTFSTRTIPEIEKCFIIRVVSFKNSKPVQYSVKPEVKVKTINNSYNNNRID